MWQERLSDRQHKEIEAVINAFRNQRLTEAKFLDKLIANGVFQHEAEEILEHEISINNL